MFGILKGMQGATSCGGAGGKTARVPGETPGQVQGATRPNRCVATHRIGLLSVTFRAELTRRGNYLNNIIK